MTFLRNHDELTLEMVTPEVRNWMWEQYAPEARMRLNMGIRRRQLPLLDGDKRRWFLLNAMFLSLPGAPIIYYGDEIGMGDNIWLADRNGVRTPMQWSNEKNGGFSAAEKTYLPVIDDEIYGYQRVNVAAQEEDADSILNWTRFLIGTRQSQPPLRSGDFGWVETDNTAVLAFRRTAETSEIVCLFNLTDTGQEIETDLKGNMVDLLARRQAVERRGTTLNLQPFAAHWLRAAG
jgi:maltose alpha-D-glucosyltransferase/alpha-amylase